MTDDIDSNSLKAARQNYLMDLLGTEQLVIIVWSMSLGSGNNWQTRRLSSSYSSLSDPKDTNDSNSLRATQQKYLFETWIGMPQLVIIVWPMSLGSGNNW